MLVLDANGDVQMKLSGGERIFSRICTRKMIKAAIHAYREDTDIAYRKVGRLVLKELDAQDNRESEYTQLEDWYELHRFYEKWRNPIKEENKGKFERLWNYVESKK